MLTSVLGMGTELDRVDRRESGIALGAKVGNFEDRGSGSATDFARAD